MLSAGMQGQALPKTPEAATPAVAPVAVPGHGFLGRFVEFYRGDWHPGPVDPNAASAPRRGLASPLDSPPFPSSDWSYGGSPTIGEADGNTYPLMAALNRPNLRTKVYGWVEPTLNFSTSAHRNAPVGNDLFSNRFELGQAVLYVERLPNSVQREHIDFGFHLTALYGTDYRYTTNKGYFSNQLLVHNRQYGFDPSTEYVDIYFPKVAQGMNLRIGRFVSIPGIETQLTASDYMFSHSMLYVIDPFTDTGVLATIQLNSQWLVQAGVSASHDVAPWSGEAKPAGMVCGSYTTKSVNDNFYVCANGINDGKYSFDNLQQYDATWYHKFSKSWHMATEAYLMYQNDVPSATGTAATLARIEPGTNGAACHAGLQFCRAPEYAFVNYLNKEINTHNFIGFRSDFLNDKKGQRTGIATRYSENTLMLSHWIGTTVQMRPEIRFDHAWDRPAYDYGARRNQFSVASDLIVHF